MALERKIRNRPERGQTAVVIGAGRSGLGAARLLNSKGIKTRLLDKNENALTNERIRELEGLGIEVVLGEHKKEDFRNANFVIPSPGMPIAKAHEYIENESPEIISEMELAWRFLDNEPVLAVTGTSGKTTTASLAASMLKAQGYTVFLGGNIGAPLSEYILANRKADALVLEVSSFQAQGCDTFSPRVGILLNISPNHLDYHKDMREYEDAKFRLFRCQDEGDLAIFGPKLEGVAERYPIKARKIWLSDENRFPGMKLLGKHNQLNAEAAWQGVKFFGVSLENATRAAELFPPLPHRLEIVGEKNGATFINDSKCTTISSLKVALEAMKRPVRLLCGGKFKGGDPSELNSLIREKTVEVGLFGASRDVFEKAWSGLVPISWSANLEEAVNRLYLNSRPGDVILLSPATASYDLYKNYEQRGDDFRRIVAELK
ncbi:MAG: UDP-N-acetylmuramoyl-L-alanine--D-glutamate ligase [Desulfovibrio sp.]|nr:UDP-N-acetylmuramoyl-L-alanine--D-glutamate ligase [Desulfovibrio sp.]